MSPRHRLVAAHVERRVKPVYLHAENGLGLLHAIVHDMDFPIRVANDSGRIGLTLADGDQPVCQRGEKPFIIILDGLEDPHNLGAVMRTAECAGAHGIIIPKRRSVSVNETVLKTSAGAAEHMLCARVTNAGRTIDELKNQGVWIYACDMGDELIYEQDMTGPLAIVIGSEGFGISRLVREKCDFVVSIPMKGQVNSLNASNAAAIIMYEVVKQRL